MGDELTFKCGCCLGQIESSLEWVESGTAKMIGVNCCSRCQKLICDQCYVSDTETCNQLVCQTSSVKTTLTKPESRTVRGQEYTYPCPRVGSVVAQFGTGFDTNWVVAKSSDIRRTRQKNCSTVRVYEVVSYPGDRGHIKPGKEVTYNPEKSMVLKLYCSKQYPGRWCDLNFRKGNEYTWDTYTPPSDHFPMGR